MDREWELGEPTGDEADGDKGQGLEECDEKQILREVASKIEEMKNKGRGNLGSYADRMADGIIEPPVSPERLIRQLVLRQCELIAGQGVRSYKRTSRMSRANRPLPKQYAICPRILFILDTSGSMSSSELGMALGMLKKVFNIFRNRDGITCITGDTSGKSKAIFLDDPSKIKLTGGGGTNMGALIIEAVQNKPKPQLIIVCTDGYTPWPSKDVGVPVIVALTDSRQDGRIPDWMHSVNIFPDRSSGS